MKRTAFALIAMAVILALTACQPEPKYEPGSISEPISEPEPKPDDGKKATPAAGDFIISGLSRIYDGSPKTIRITPRQGKSSGTITIYYNGTRTAPSAVGSYAVTFDVAAATGWNAVKGLNAGTLDILQTASQGKVEYYWINEHGSLVTSSGGEIIITAGETLTITAQGEGYDVKQWHLNGINTDQSGNTFNFSRNTAGKHTVGLFVEKDGELYNTNITITVTM